MQAWKGAAQPREESEALTLTSHLRGINAHLSTESCFLAVTFMVKEMSGMRRGKQRPLLPEEQAFCGVTAGSKPGVAGKPWASHLPLPNLSVVWTDWMVDATTHMSWEATANPPGVGLGERS